VSVVCMLDRRARREQLHREIVRLNLEGLGDAEISRRLDVNLKTVKDALDRPARDFR